MAKLYKRLLFMLIIVCSISGAAIYFTVDINTVAHINMFKGWALAGVFLASAVGLFFDGTRLMHLVKISGEKISIMEAVYVVFSNYFLALVTPGMAGGAVAQVLFLHRAGVPTGKATVVVVVRTLLSIMFLLFCLPLIFYYDPYLVPWVSSGGLVVAALIVILVCILIILMLRTRYLNYFLAKLTHNMERCTRRKVFRLYWDIKAAVRMLVSNKLSILRVFIESALSLISLYAVVPILFWGMDIVFDWAQVIGRMICLNIILYFAPTPGASGIAEGGFIIMFNSILPKGTVGILAVAWRMISEYIPFIIGFYFTVKEFGHDFIVQKLTKRQSQ